MKEMAELLRKGAKMLSVSCPECSSPLFQLKTGEMFCSKCKKDVKILNEGEDISQIKIFSNLEKTIFNKIQYLEKKLETEEDVSKITSFSAVIISLIDTLKKINDYEKNKLK